MTRPTSKTGPGNGLTDSQQFIGLVNVALRQSKRVLHLLDTDVQAECKYRSPDGRVIFIHILVHLVHSTHCFVVTLDKERLTNVNSLCICSFDHLFADCSGCTQILVVCLPATRTLISLKLKDKTQRSCQYPHFVTKPDRFTPDELLCTVFVKKGDHGFIDTQVLLFHESKVPQESLIFLCRGVDVLSPSCHPHPVLCCQLDGCISLYLQIGFL